MLLSDLSWIEFKERMNQIEVAVIPLGSIEQTGPLLPLGTDFYIAQELSLRVSAREDSVVLPPLPCGYAPYHMDYPGTVSIEEGPLRAYILSICESLVQWGIRRFVFINGHGGNRSVLESISIHLRRTYNTFSAIIQWWDFASEGDPDWKVVGHGDAASIAVMMRVRPHLVKQGRENLRPLPLSENLKPRFWTQTGFGDRTVNIFLNTSDFTAAGAFGFDKSANPAEARREKGERILQRTAEFIGEIIEEMKRLPLQKPNRS